MNEARTLVFIPTYNCAAQVRRVLQRLEDAGLFARMTEVAVIDNRSSDQTVETALSFKAKFPNLKVLRNVQNYGLGGSHKVAFHYAIDQGFERLVVLHGDDQAEASEIHRLIGRMDADPRLDAVLGDRFAPASGGEGYSWIRRLGNRALNGLFTLILGRPVRDLGAGLNLYRVSRLKTLDFDRYSDYCDYNIFLLLAMIGDGWNFEFTPITWREEDQVSNTSALRMGWRALSALFKWKWNRRSVEIPVKERPFEYC
jgi:dolichol-phosphate mannosyltransferase